MRTNILTEFFESKESPEKSYGKPLIEVMEIDFQDYMTNGKGECDALDFVNEMCIESLSPENFEAWEIIKKELKQNRYLLKKFDYAV